MGTEWHYLTQDIIVTISYGAKEMTLIQETEHGLSITSGKEEMPQPKFR